MCAIKSEPCLDGMVIYIASKITGEANYRIRLFATAERLRSFGAIVLHTADLPFGLEYEEYIKIGYAMLDAADAIYLLSDWEDSRAVRREADRAKLLGIIILEEGNTF